MDDKRVFRTHNKCVYIYFWHDFRINDIFNEDGSVWGK